MLRLHGNCVFGPGVLRSLVAALKEAYARAGYQEAMGSADQVTCNESTGAVTVEVAAHEGLPTIVRSVTVQARSGDETSHAHRNLSPANLIRICGN